MNAADPGNDQAVAGIPIRFVRSALILLLVIAAVKPLVATIEDPDFFWHLQTGRWIWEHKALPQEFLFSQTAPDTMNDAQRVTMTSYWFVQVLYHLLYSAGGLTAIALLRVALMALLVGTLAARSARRDAAVFLGTALLGVVLLRRFPFERPQVFSFIFFSLLLLLLERLRSAPAGTAAPRRILLGLSLLMILWANCHGGFIIGQATLLLIVVTEGLKFVHPALGPLPPNRYRFLLGAGALGSLSAFCNPNTYHVFLAARLPAWAKTGNIEYASTAEIFRAYGDPIMPVSWILLALALLSFVLPRTIPDITRLALVTGTGTIAFAEVRYLPFFMICAVPTIEESFSRGARSAASRTLLLATALVTGICLLPNDLDNLRHYRGANKINTISYPEDAADFILSRRPEGNPYTFWAWSGYLLWRIAPAKMFIDGRNSSHEVFLMNAAIESGNTISTAGAPPWKTIFHAYGIRYAVLPIFDPQRGEVMELLFALGASPDWDPAFIGYNSVVFIESSSDNRRTVPPAFDAPEQFFAELVRRCEELNKIIPANPFPSIARGELLSRLHRYGEARAAYRDALKLMPFNRLARKRLAALPNSPSL